MGLGFDFLQKNKKNLQCQRGMGSEASTQAAPPPSEAPRGRDGGYRDTGPPAQGPPRPAAQEAASGGAAVARGPPAVGSTHTPHAEAQRAPTARARTFGTPRARGEQPDAPAAHGGDSHERSSSRRSSAGDSSAGRSRPQVRGDLALLMEADVQVRPDAHRARSSVTGGAVASARAVGEQPSGGGPLRTCSSAGASVRRSSEANVTRPSALVPVHASLCSAALTEGGARGWTRLQIPQIVSAVDFDMQNPEHLRAFEEEMTEMMSGAIKRQQRVQRVHDVTTKAKLTGRELELAMQGLDVANVREMHAVGATCSSRCTHAHGL